MDTQGYAEHSQLKPPVLLDGSGKEGSVGPSVGLLDVGISDEAYLFRIALPGIRKIESQVKFEIHSDGKVLIQGMLTDGDILQDSPSVYQLTVQQICSTGPFSISFNLPGPCDPRLIQPNFRSDGVLEVVVQKCVRRIPGEGLFSPP
ncbi:HSP20 domain-containing protein [Cephalotus follicularis]|uniref:HSP20 domain-containing protein n=1 Tax=Cephalotus follicularis TaxID=3775 RepID=A0A1Q3D5X6_CEPFO|nr:HSP20 domain-containing protein [Cephalotus follicularis]